MPDSTSHSTDDPTIQLVRRFRRPALVVVAVFLIVGQLPRLTSGDPWNIAGALLNLAFLAYLLLGMNVPGPKNEGNANWWRRQALWHVKGGAAWLALGVVWLLLAVARDDFYYARMGSLAIPAAVVLLGVFEYRKRHRLAEINSPRA